MESKLWWLLTKDYTVSLNKIHLILFVHQYDNSQRIFQLSTYHIRNVMSDFTRTHNHNRDRYLYRL